MPELTPQMLEKWEPVIGLEVHAQLATESKMFCSCKRIYGVGANTRTCPVCLAYPGTLPVVNAEAIRMAIRMGLAVNCSIRHQSQFARKNYFYPDLSKGYQISQYDDPICYEGNLLVSLDDGTLVDVGITRIHLEEDSGKTIHGTDNRSYVDFNRCGTPLIEIVSEPDIRSAHEAKRYLERLKQTLEYTGVSEADMEKGHLRCDANVSVRLRGAEQLGTRTEMKNLNSFRGVERGINYEIVRQIKLLEDGGTVAQCTLNWDDAAGKTHVLRTKEEADDYRYFPEPDLVPLLVTQAQVNEAAQNLPELPAAVELRFAKDYGLKAEDVEVLTRTRELAGYFENVVQAGASPGDTANWVLSEVLRVLNEEKEGIEHFGLKPEELAELIGLVSTGLINRNTAKSVFEHMLEEGLTASAIVERDGLAQVSDEVELEATVSEVVERGVDELERYRNGEKKLFSFFMGQVMAATRGKGDPKIVRELLQKVLDN